MMRAAMSKAPNAANDRGPETHTTDESPDFRPLSGYAAKRFESLRAAAALNGAELYRLDDGRFLLARWGRGRELATLDAAAAFLAGMGVRE